MPLLKDGGLNLSLDPQSVLRIFGHSYRRRVLSHCFGCWVKSHPYGRWVKSHVSLSHCFGCCVKSPPLPPSNSKEDIWSSQMAYRPWILIKSTGFSTSRAEIAEISSNSEAIVNFSNRLLTLDSDI